MIENTNALGAASVSVKSKATPVSPNERRGPPSTPVRSVNDRILQSKWDEANKEMNKGNHRSRALVKLFGSLEPGIAKNAIAVLMSSDDESEDNCQYFDDSESDDDEKKNPPRSDKATSSLPGARIEFQTRGAPHCHMLI